MRRRDVIRTAMLTGAGALTAGMGASTTAVAATAVPRVVYHVADIEKAGFAVGNMRNHIDGMGGPGAVTIALVVHGPALRMFRADTRNEGLKRDLAGLQRDGVTFYACHHTMAAMKLTLPDLLPGFAVADKGGVVKLAELQAQGWLYLRP